MLLDPELFSKFSGGSFGWEVKNSKNHTAGAVDHKVGAMFSCKLWGNQIANLL